MIRATSLRVLTACLPALALCAAWHAAAQTPATVSGKTSAIVGGLVDAVKQTRVLPAQPAAPVAPPASATHEMYSLLGNEQFEDWQTSIFFSLELSDRLEAIFSLLAAGKQDDAIDLATAQKEASDPIDVLVGGQPSVPGIPGEVATGAPGTAVAASNKLDSPYFFLSTVIYHGPGDWALWLNGQRLTARKPDSPDGTIEVVDVSPNAAMFSWSPSQYNKVEGRVLAAAARENATEASTIPGALPAETEKPKPNDLPLKGRLAVRAPDKRLLFILKTNQTFYTEKVRFAEGLPQQAMGGAMDIDERARLGGKPKRKKPATNSLDPNAPPSMAAVAPDTAPGTVPPLAAPPSPMAGMRSDLPTAGAEMGYRDIGGMINRQ